MLSLPNVTLCSIHTVCHELSLLAVDECLKQVTFGDVKLFTDKPLGRDVIHLDKLGADEFAKFVNYELPGYITTSHILFIQWDSWIINPGAWQDIFLAYDYIGAPWGYKDNYNVGNSGFCLRSKRLMTYLADNRQEFPIGSPEDHVLCREYQKRLLQFRWAPSELAWKFAVERSGCYPLNEVFGFHGIFNWDLILSPEALQERLSMAEKEPYITSKHEWQEIIGKVNHVQTDH